MDHIPLVEIEDWMVIKIMKEYFDIPPSFVAEFFDVPVEYVENSLNALNIKDIDFEYQLEVLRIITDAIVNKNDIDSPTSKEDLPVFILGDIDGKDRLQPKIQ